MIPTIIISCIIAAAVVAILVRGIVNKKNGKIGCSCGCEHCSNSDFCHGGK